MPLLPTFGSCYTDCQVHVHDILCCLLETLLPRGNNFTRIITAGSHIKLLADWQTAQIFAVCRASQKCAMAGHWESGRQLCNVLGNFPHTHTHTHTTVLRLHGCCPGQPGWAGTRRNIHPLTPIMVINHPFFHLIRSMASSLFNPRAWQYFSTICLQVFLDYLLAWNPPLHTPYISSPNHCLLFATHAHAIAACFTVIPSIGLKD